MAVPLTAGGHPWYADLDAFLWAVTALLPPDPAASFELCAHPHVALAIEHAATRPITYEWMTGRARQAAIFGGAALIVDPVMTPGTWRLQRPAADGRAEPEIIRQGTVGAIAGEVALPPSCLR